MLCCCGLRACLLACLFLLGCLLKFVGFACVCLFCLVGRAYAGFAWNVYTFACLLGGLAVRLVCLVCVSACLFGAFWLIWFACMFAC